MNSDSLHHAPVCYPHVGMVFKGTFILFFYEAMDLSYLLQIGNVRCLHFRLHDMVWNAACSSVGTFFLNCPCRWLMLYILNNLNSCVYH